MRKLLEHADRRDRRSRWGPAKAVVCSRPALRQQGRLEPPGRCGHYILCAREPRAAKRRDDERARAEAA